MQSHVYWRNLEETCFVVFLGALFRDFAFLCSQGDLSVVGSGRALLQSSTGCFHLHLSRFWSAGKVGTVSKAFAGSVLFSLCRV